MQVAITCRHGSISESVRDYITRKSEKLLTYFERVTSIQVTVIFENDRVKEERVKVEMLVDAEHRHNFVSRDQGEDVPSAFDKSLHKMEQQIRKYKEKLQDHRRDRPLSEVVGGDLEEADSEPTPPGE